MRIPRLDFANYDLPNDTEEEQLIAAWEEVAKDIDILCVSDQLGILGRITPKVAEKIVKLAKGGLRVVVDSRDRIARYSNMYLKLNEIEGYRTVYNQPYPKGTTYAEMIDVGRALAVKNSATVISDNVGSSRMCHLQYGE